MRLYKLTDADDQAYNGWRWGENVQHRTTGEGDLCGPGWTHWYTDPLLAVLLNPVQGNFDLANAHLWEGEGTPEKLDCGLKVGCRDGRTLRQIELPYVTTEQRVRFAILCALQITQRYVFQQWAEGWLSGTRPSAQAARAQLGAARAAVLAVGAARAAMEGEAKEARVRAAVAARRAGTTRTVAWVPEARAAARKARALAARKAAETAALAAEAKETIDLAALAHEAVGDQSSGEIRLSLDQPREIQHHQHSRPNHSAEDPAWAGAPQNGNGIVAAIEAGSRSQGLPPTPCGQAKDIAATGDILGILARRIQGRLRTWRDAGSGSFPTVGELQEELTQLQREFEHAEFDLDNETIRAITEPIVLEGVPLGRFRIELDVGPGGARILDERLRVIALEPHPCPVDGWAIHPHVCREHLCCGDGAAALTAAFKAGRIADFFLLVGGVLRTYNSRSRFFPLEQWDGSVCDECRRHVSPNTCSQCETCGSLVCQECRCRHSCELGQEEAAG